MSAATPTPAGDVSGEVLVSHLLAEHEILRRIRVIARLWGDDEIGTTYEAWGQVLEALAEMDGLAL